MGGLETLPDAPTVARILIAATGEAPTDLRIAGQGVTALTWRADTEHGAYAVLVALPGEGYRDEYPDAEPRFEARVAVGAALHERDPRCPAPVATDRSPGIPESLRAWRWMVTAWADGDVGVRPVTSSVARDLGEVLAALHALPAAGHGMLEDTREAVRGREATPAAGFASRWGEELWPYDGRPLVAHPLVQAAPHLVPAVGELREQLLAYQDGSARAICHTDLSAAHLAVRDGRLVGLIDFGDAAVLPPAFDIAAFAYHEGWEAAEHLLEGYTANSVLRDLRRAEAYQLAVVVGLQKVHKHVKRLPDADRLRRAVTFLEATLPRASRRQDA